MSATLTVLATICHIGACQDVIVTDNDMTPNLTMTQCLMGQPQIAKWKNEHPTYFSETYTITGYRCVMGKYQPKVPA